MFVLDQVVYNLSQLQEVIDSIRVTIALLLLLLLLGLGLVLLVVAVLWLQLPLNIKIFGKNYLNFRSLRLTMFLWGGFTE